jgi:hypothetical protein
VVPLLLSLCNKKRFFKIAFLRVEKVFDRTYIHTFFDYLENIWFEILNKGCKEMIKQDLEKDFEINIYISNTFI